jgi:hypothetical protein
MKDGLQPQPMNIQYHLIKLCLGWTELSRGFVQDDLHASDGDLILISFCWEKMSSVFVKTIFTKDESDPGFQKIVFFELPD